VINLQQSNNADLTDFLRSKNWIEASETLLSTEIPGSGNMNYVLRVKTNQRSLIIKQANDFVQKFPQIAAPINRIVVENSFYEAVAHSKISTKMPQIIGFDPKMNCLAMTDLGANTDFTWIYKSGNSKNLPIKSIFLFLRELHQIKIQNQHNYPDNLDLRLLNHEHLIVFPLLVENGFDLDSIQLGLQALAIPLKKNEQLKLAMKEIGDVYLSTGNVLLHGDYYPGSWMDTTDGFKVIDPEFSFMGPAEYDLGVLLAHLEFSKIQASVYQNELNDYFTTIENIDKQLVQKFKAMELIRRLIGIAQLPLSLSLNEKSELLDKATKTLLT
jgi:5-methylthioribose kinase